MRKKTIFSILLVLFVLLCGCSNHTDVTESTPPPTTTAPPTTAATEPPTEAPTEPQTEPPVALEEGPGVYVNGIAIASTGRYDSVIYASAAEFCQALGGSVNADGSATVNYLVMELTFSPYYSHMMRFEKAVVLRSPIVNNESEALLPLEELCEMLHLSVFHDAEQDTVYCTAAAWPGEVPEGYDVPTLMYHAVSNDTWGITSLFVKPEILEQQLQYLTENGYDPIFFEDLYHLEEYDKPVLLTFDDGYADNYTELFPLLQKYNVKATVFIITDLMNTDKYLTTEQIQEMAASGLVSIQSHTASHPNLDTLSLEDQLEELERSKLEVTRLCLREPYVICYPTGRYNDDTLEAAPDYYFFGLKMNGGMYHTSDDPFLINRSFVSRNTTLEAFKALLG